MNLTLPILLLASIVLTGAACPKSPDRVDCQKACTNLALILSQDREAKNLSRYEGLDLNTQEGQRNIERCVQDCLSAADMEQVDCLAKAVCVETWLGCD